ncbi:hypothetical protein LSH36_91g02028 [Paralvinella palmiformis]|uniref:Protein SERAC1 n=1 Tax=Paralvinella palmiformis TaxID=53620 RepID=A0AAD9K122_9ANNE|nr:hypothetical protein LSH36_91g02028 [Paralvinella palmiformis]
MLLHSVLCDFLLRRHSASQKVTWHISKIKATAQSRPWSSLVGQHQERRTGCFSKPARDCSTSSLRFHLDLKCTFSTTTSSQQRDAISNGSWSKSVIKACLLTCTAVGLILAGLIYRTIQNINNTLSVFSNREHADHWLYSYLDLNKQALILPWLQLYHSDLGSLLELCYSDDHTLRQLGVQGLAAVDDWPDWEYYLSSMLIDTRTLIGLARTEGANQKLFPRPSRILSLQDNVLSQLQELLSELPTDDVDKCTKYFTMSALKDKPRYKQDKLEPVTNDEADHNCQLRVLLALEGHSQDWLAEDHPNLRILTVDYETYLSEWTPKCPYENERRTLLTRSKEFLEKLRASGLGDRPIIWVAHSMGGLLVKQMLLLASEDQSMSDILRQTKGIVFYSVPHRGSPLSVYMSRTKYLLYPSAEVKLLYQGSKVLLDLHKKFKTLIMSKHIPLLSFGEGSKTNLPFNIRAMFVPAESSDPGFGEFHLMKDHNHLTICKPISKQTMLYQQTLNFITHCIPHCSEEEIPCDN